MTVARFVVATVSFVSTVVVAAGCNSRPTAVQTAASMKATDPAEELTQSVRDELRQTADQATCRRVVDILNGYLPRLAADRQIPPLSTADRTLFATELGLRPEEIADVARGDFTTVDAYFLE